MLLVRYESQEGARFGALEGDRITPLEGEFPALSPAPRARPVALGRARLLAPIVPSKIVAVGLNYRDHARELGLEPPTEPLLFMKPPSAVIGPGGKILRPPETESLHYEGELAILIGKRARRVKPAEALRHVLGYTCFNDVTARDLQRRDVQFTRAKSFDTFAPLGPAIATGLDPSDLALTTRLNGEIRQRSRTSNLIFKCDYLVSYVSGVMTLEPGDVIATGTPSGVGAMNVGDVVEVEIERIGCLVNTVVAEAQEGA